MLLSIFVFIILIISKQRTDIKEVNVQLAFQLIATFLFLIRSTARVITGDDTYYGDNMPQWTLTCKKLGIIISIVQYWIYVSIYLETALVFRLYFGSETIGDHYLRKKKERCMSLTNGALYVVVLSVLLVNLLTPDVIADMFFKMATAWLSCCYLYYSYKVLVPLMSSCLDSTGIYPNKSFLVVQMFLYGLVGVVDCFYAISSIQFHFACTDKKLEQSKNAVST